MVKKITIPCFFGSQKSDIDFYIGNPRPEDHPIHHQATWLSSERGGNVPSEVMDAITKLRNLANKNNVSFEELCFYAINKAAVEKEKEDRTKLENTIQESKSEEKIKTTPAEKESYEKEEA
jgi:hypothetical protein